MASDDRKPLASDEALAALRAKLSGESVTLPKGKVALAIEINPAEIAASQITSDVMEWLKESHFARRRLQAWLVQKGKIDMSEYDADDPEDPTIANDPEFFELLAEYYRRHRGIKVSAL